MDSVPVKIEEPCNRWIANQKALDPKQANRASDFDPARNIRLVSGNPQQKRYYGSGNRKKLNVGLPGFSKLFERIMYRRLMSFINKHKLLYPNQFGFRENHGTNIALTFLYNKILKSLDNGDYVLGLFLDFKKAFDTVNHDILLRKLYLIWNKRHIF